MNDKSFTKTDETSGMDEICSKAVRAGRRTYFFDVKATRGGEYFLTVSESRRVETGDGEFRFEKNKIFLYKEDFEKFFDALSEMTAFIKEKQSAESSASIDEEFEQL